MKVFHFNGLSFCSIPMSAQFHRSTPPIIEKWLGCGLLHALQRRSCHSQLLHVNVPLNGLIWASLQLYQVPLSVKNIVNDPHKAWQCRCFSAVAFQDAASQASIGNSKEVEAQTMGNDLSKMGAPINRVNGICTRIKHKNIVDADLGLKQTIVVQESLQALEDLLKELETSALDEDGRIGALCLRLAQLCVSKDESPEKILVYAQRALKILGCPEISLECATCLEVIGCAYYKKGEFEKAINHLAKAALILEKLKRSVKQEDMGSLQYAVQALLGQANMALGRQEEALVNFQDALAINERVLQANDPNLGKSYQEVAEAFLQAQDLNEALSLCLKALPIYIDCHGSSSAQVAELRKLLSVIYYDLDDFDKVLSENQLVRPIFEALGKIDDVASIDLASGEAFLCLDKYAEAICKLKDVLKQTTHENHCHGQALVLLAKAHTALKEKKNAITYCNRALSVLKNKELSAKVGASLVELGLVLRQLNEIEQSLSVFRMALELYQNFPREQAAVAFIEGQIGLLYLGLERAIEALPYLEACVNKNESLLGLESEELLDLYNHLGVAYLQSGKYDKALSKFEAAKTIAEQNNLSKDPATIPLYNNLAHVYAALGRVGDALLCQRLLLETINKTGDQSNVCLEEAEKKLQDLLQEVAKLQESTEVPEPVLE